MRSWAWGPESWGRKSWGRGSCSRGVGVWRVRVGGVGVAWVVVLDCDTNPNRSTPLSKLPTPTPLHTFCVKSALRQIVFASSRLRQVCPRQIVRVKLSCTLLHVLYFLYCWWDNGTTSCFLKTCISNSMSCQRVRAN